MWSDAERELITEAYQAQCEEGLFSMEQALLQLEMCPDDAEALNQIFRACHTLKGDSATLGFSSPAAFSHILEDLLEKVRSGLIPPRADLITLLLESVDALRNLVSDAVEGNEGEKDRYAPLAARLQAWATGNLIDNDTSELSIEEVAESSQKSGSSESSGTAAAAEDDSTYKNQTLRIRVETLDRLLNLTGEIAIGRSYVDQMLSDEQARDSRELIEAYHALDPLFLQLQEEVMKIRMVPIGPLFRHYLRTVRDLGVDNNKQVRLAIEGEDAELDTTVIEHLRGCLGHMVRNSVAHGIESPEERTAKGKDPCGLITLAARHEGSNIVVEVGDDGAGLNLERILNKARAAGLIAPTDTPHDDQLAQMVFEPGFSTAEGSNLSSGRGVGMDVVRRNIESLGGTVSIRSTEGKGSTIAIRLPLTLAIVEGFTVGIGEERYVIPLASVTECLDVPEREAGMNSGIINLRGKALPFIRLRQLLGTECDAPARENIVVIHHQDEEAGVVVDRLYGESQVVIKPLDRFFRSLPGISGSTILGDGRVALILDVPSLLGRSIGWHRASGREDELLSTELTPRNESHGEFAAPS